MKPKIIENVLPSSVNQVIKDKLLLSKTWQIVTDGLPLDVFSSIYQASDGGMLLFSYQKDSDKNLENIELNVFADMIFQLVLQKCEICHKFAKVPEFSNIELHRHLWNYYNGNSKGVEHTDKDVDDFYSIVYYLNTTDGGTTIIIDNDGKEFFSPSVEGNCVIFPSTAIHWGTGAPNNGHRLALNILFKGIKNNISDIV